MNGWNHELPKGVKRYIITAQLIQQILWCRMLWKDSSKYLNILLHSHIVFQEAPHTYCHGLPKTLYCYFRCTLGPKCLHTSRSTPDRVAVHMYLIPTVFCSQDALVLLDHSVCPHTALVHQESRNDYNLIRKSSRSHLITWWRSQCVSAEKPPRPDIYDYGRRIV